MKQHICPVIEIQMGKGIKLWEITSSAGDSEIKTTCSFGTQAVKCGNQLLQQAPNCLYTSCSWYNTLAFWMALLLNSAIDVKHFLYYRQVSSSWEVKSLRLIITETKHFNARCKKCFKLTVNQECQPNAWENIQFAWSRTERPGCWVLRRQFSKIPTGTNSAKC